MWLLLALAGCDANRIVGTVEGQRVPVETVFARVVQGAFGDDDLLVVSLVSVPSACPVFQFWEDEVASTTDPADLADAWAAAFPPDWWQVDVVARVAGGTLPAPGAVWLGLEVDAFPEAPGTAFASVTHFRGWRDEAFFAGESEADEDLWLSDGGAVKWTDIAPSERFAGRFNTRLVDADGRPGDEIEIRFDATPCPLVGTVGAVARAYIP